MKSDIHQATQSKSTLYCTGCNVRFLRALEDKVCPRCGAQLHRDSALVLDETLLIRDLDGSGPIDRKSSVEPELDVLIGRELHIYRCDSLLGRGGMGRVYLAEHRDLGRHCALKILAPRLAANDKEYVARFHQEARVAAALVHPNIVVTHAMGEAGGFHFLEMEFVAGRSLQQLVSDEGRLTPVRATALAVQMAEGLAAAHRAGIVHRDLKPDNVLLTRHGTAKIADFGLAKRIVASESGAHRLVGTPNFMAPELFSDSTSTPASDVYALGVCYFLLLTGRLPFIGGTLQDLRQQDCRSAAAHRP